MKQKMIERRMFLKWAGASVLANAMPMRMSWGNAERKSPNIVILYADDMGYGDLKIQNSQSKIPTPNLDRLACEGLCFRDAHSSSGICPPSRYALLTGRYHWRKFHDIVESFGPSVFDKDRLTLPAMLRARGYRTACIGKWHLGWNWDAIRRGPAPQEKREPRCEDFDWSKRIPDGPCDHGFDTYFGDDVPNFPPYTWFENDRVLKAPTERYAPNPMPTEGNPEGRPGPMAEGWRQDEVMPTLTKKAVEWIGKQRGKKQPFFLYFPWTSPHAPIVPAKEFQGTTQAGGYGDYVHQSDWCAGEVLAALDKHGFRENTLVIFTSDNGPEAYAYDRIRNFGHRSMGPLRGLKRDTWEGGHRVPFIVRWPGVIKAGAISDALISQIDLMATLAAITGYELPDTAAEDSFDLSPLLYGERLSSPVRSSLVHNTREDKYAIRQGEWIYFNCRSGEESKSPEWYEQSQCYEKNQQETALYNLRLDIAERSNLMESHPDKAAELHSLLQQIREQGCSAPRLCTRR